jgi:hypothetical protein
MRPRSIVAIAAVIVAVALVGLPAPAGSTAPSTVREPAPGAFSSVAVPTVVAATGASATGVASATAASAGRIDATTALSEPGVAPAVPSSRPRVTQPVAASGEGWKQARQVLRGQATYYDNGTTAMRLPRGTVVRICGDGGCIERVVTDYGPQKESRVVDLYTPDFFAVCGCGSWNGVTTVTVYVY